MESPPPRNHIACQNLQRFMIETLELPPENSCTCLAEGRDMICQRYPDLAPQIVVFYAQAEEFWQTLLPSSQIAENPHERVICFNADENVRPDSGGASHTLDSGTCAVEKDDSLVVSAVQHMDLLDVNYTQCQGDLDVAPRLETSSGISGTHILSSKDVEVANDEENSESIQADGEVSPRRTILSPMMVYTNLQRESGQNQSFDREPKPQCAITCNRKILMQSIEHSSNTRDHRSPSSDFALAFLGTQGVRQRTTLPVNIEDSGVEREEERKRGAEGVEEEGMEHEKQEQEHRKVYGSEEGEYHVDEGVQKDTEVMKDKAEQQQEEEEEEEEEAEAEAEAEAEDDDSGETADASPTPVRHKKAKKSVRRGRVDPVDPGPCSGNHQSNKRPLQDNVTKSPPLKRPKVATHVDIEFQTPGTTTASTRTPVDQSFWDEWDMKRAAMTHHGQQTDQSVKAVRVWRRLSSRYSSGLSRGRRRQHVAPRNVDGLVTMVLAVANCYAFKALKEVMGHLQQHSAAWTSEIFSNDPKALVETMNTIETAGHLNSYLRRFGLARLANMYLETAANGGRLTLNNERACPSSRTVVTNPHKAEAYIAMILHIWGIPFPAHYKGAKMTRGGLIDSTAADALQWNKCKARLRKQIDAGQRWLGLATRVGWSTLGLITRDWSIGDSKVVASDRIFEEVLIVSEYDALLDEIDAAKGRFLRQLNKTLGASLFDLLKDPNRAQNLPLLQLRDQDIMTRVDGDPQWINELISLSDIPAQDS